MPSSDPVQRFSDIIDNIERIARFTAGMDLHGFAGNEQTILTGCGTITKASIPFVCGC